MKINGRLHEGEKKIEDEANSQSVRYGFGENGGRSCHPRLKEGAPGIPNMKKKREEKRKYMRV
jgi:hypothetical protein